MSIFPGDVVVLNTARVSVAGGERRTFDSGMVGRVCRVSETGSGICWVQFAKQCLRVREDFLSPTDQSAPPCTEDCVSGY